VALTDIPMEYGEPYGRVDLDTQILSEVLRLEKKRRKQFLAAKYDPALVTHVSATLDIYAVNPNQQPDQEGYRLVFLAQPILVRCYDKENPIFNCRKPKCRQMSMAADWQSLLAKNPQNQFA